MCMLTLSSCNNDLKNIDNINVSSAPASSSEVQEPSSSEPEASSEEAAASEETVSRTPQELAAELADMINQARADSNIAPLTFTDEMNAVAAVRAEELKTSYSHTRPDGTDCTTAFNKSYMTAGELIAKDCKTPDEAYSFWMAKGNRRSILFNEGGYSFDTAGIAVSVDDAGNCYWALCAIQAVTDLFLISPDLIPSDAALPTEPAT